MKLKPVLVVCALALAITSVAGGAASKTPATPTGLHPFRHVANDSSSGPYALMPAFAWNAVRDASSYELQLATSSVFSEATTLYDRSYSAPVASVQLQLPWMTGKPFALWVRVRAIGGGHVSLWSSPFGFNTSWEDKPKQLKAPDGLIRWSTVAGATQYEVWIDSPWSSHFTTLTNVADLRERSVLSPGATGTIQWRVRAVRLVTTPSLPNGIRAVRYGPYSKWFPTDVPGAPSGGEIKAVAAVSDVESTSSTTRAHQLTPGFAWTGTTDSRGVGSNVGLWRVYIFSDKECVNPVMNGSLVGTQAWAPRDADPIQFLGYPAAGDDAVLRDGSPSAPSESLAAASTAGGGAAGSTPPAGAATPAAGSSSPTPVAHRLISLPDNGWPQGRFWWTVVPVLSVGSKLIDSMLPQDLCEAGHVWTFGMQSVPLTANAQNAPYASGLVNSSRVVSAARRSPSFRELPLITWTPALAAQSYEIELSRHAYPWVAVKKQTSVVTSAVLPLSKSERGVWYYRVRGINPNLVGPAQKLTWSQPVPIRITGDIFKILKK
jgi:hypothetical protein